MSKQIDNISTKTLQDYIGLTPTKKCIKKQDNAYLDDVNLASGIYHLTPPVFTVNDNYALIYKENRFGGALVIYQKIKDKWQAVASVSVWVS
jgi:hypothetical protein